jgi:hypothetical protein
MAAKKLANDKACAVVTRRAELADVKKSRIHLVASLRQEGCPMMRIRLLLEARSPVGAPNELTDLK